MSIVDRPRPLRQSDPSRPRPRKPAQPAHGVCSLTLSVNGQKYRVRPIDPGFAGVRAFRLAKLGTDAVYDVVQQADGTIVCDCADATFRRNGLTDLPCKHGAAGLAAGLFSKGGGQ